MRPFEFTEDFPGFKKGDITDKLDNSLCVTLIGQGVGKFVDSEASKKVVEGSTKAEKTENKPKRRGRKPKAK